MRSAELSEAAWARIEPLMPQAEGRSRPWRDHRQVVEGIVFRYRTGISGCFEIFSGSPHAEEA